MFKNPDLRRKLENLAELNNNSQDRSYSLVGNATDSNDIIRACERVDKIAPHSMKLSDLNETQLEMYLNPYNNRHLDDGFNISKLNFTWEVVAF